jgi:hypothetical protein
MSANTWHFASVGRTVDYNLGVLFTHRDQQIDGVGYLIDHLQIGFSVDHAPEGIRYEAWSNRQENANNGMGVRFFRPPAVIDLINGLPAGSPVDELGEVRRNRHQTGTGHYLLLLAEHELNRGEKIKGD